MELRGGLWTHLGIIFGNLCATLGVQAGLGGIFSKISANFGSPNGGQNRSGEAKKSDVASVTDFNGFLRDFGSEMNVSNSTICVFVEYDVKCMSTFQYC